MRPWGNGMPRPPAGGGLRVEPSFDAAEPQSADAETPGGNETRPGGPSFARPIEPAPAMRAEVFPLLTGLILAVLIGVYACEWVFAVSPSDGMDASLSTLLALGALQRGLVAAGQWYRLLTAALLHLNPLHLAMNGVCLFLAGKTLETLVGRAWFALIFVLGAIGGSLVSLAVNPATLVSVGASGAIMALFAAILTISFRFGPTAVRAKLQANSLYILVPSLIPIGTSVASGRVDLGAHLGGALTGLILGLLITRIWPRNAILPGLRLPAAVLAAAGGLAFALSTVAVAQGYRVFALASGLIPSAQLPKTDAEAVSRSEELLSRYPNDPRAHYFRGFALMRAGDGKGAESELKAALAEEEVIRLELTPAFEMGVRSLLAGVLSDQGKTDEAKAGAKAACASKDTQAALRAILNKAHLCE
jgi:rhomboid protease GluP